MSKSSVRIATATGAEVALVWLLGPAVHRAIEKGILSGEALRAIEAHTPETTGTREQPLSSAIGGQHKNAGLIGDPLDCKFCR